MYIFPYLHEYSPHYFSFTNKCHDIPIIRFYRSTNFVHIVIVKYEIVILAAVFGFLNCF